MQARYPEKAAKLYEEIRQQPGTPQAAQSTHSTSGSKSHCMSAALHLLLQSQHQNVWPVSGWHPALQPHHQTCSHLASPESLAHAADVPTLDTLENMPYTEACLKESLRLYPSAAVGNRECQQDCIIGGYKIKKGTYLKCALLSALVVMGCCCQVQLHTLLSLPACCRQPVRLSMIYTHPCLRA